MPGVYGERRIGVYNEVTGKKNKYEKKKKNSRRESGSCILTYNRRKDKNTGNRKFIYNIYICIIHNIQRNG